MYAVIQSGGKQYRVTKGQTLKLETLPADVGAAVHFDNVMMVASEGNVQIGTPYIKGGKVSAKVISQGRHKKIRIIKFRRRKHYEKQQGHRQNFTEVEITDITL